MDSYKILKQAAPGDTNWAEAYQVPVPAATTVSSGAVTVGPKAVSAQTQTLITSILVISSASSTYSIAVGDSSISAGSVPFSNMIVYQKALAANNNDVLSLGLTLGSGDKIFFKEDTGTVAYTIMGIEIT